MIYKQGQKECLIKYLVENQNPSKETEILETGSSGGLARCVMAIKKFEYFSGEQNLAKTQK